jgi:hypothetical protein
MVDKKKDARVWAGISGEIKLGCSCDYLFRGFNCWDAGGKLQLLYMATDV